MQPIKLNPATQAVKRFALLRLLASEVEASGRRDVSDQQKHSHGDHQCNHSGQWPKNNHKRMMTGIGTPISQSRSPRPIVSSIKFIESP